jgi:hypothetical protein
MQMIFVSAGVKGIQIITATINLIMLSYQLAICIKVNGKGY